MCQACVILAMRRAGAAAPVDPALAPRGPARFAAVAEWADAPDGDPAADDAAEPGPGLAIDEERR